MDANDLKSIQTDAVARKNEENRRREIAERQRLAAKRQAIMDRSTELFEDVLPHLKEEAEKGYSHYHYSYGDSQENFWLAEAVAEEARKRGFKTKFDSSESDMGDSSAPCRVTFRWVDISWS